MVLALAAWWVLQAAAQRPTPKIPKEVAGLPYHRAERFEDPRLGMGILYRTEASAPPLPQEMRVALGEVFSAWLVPEPDGGEEDR